MVYIYIYIIVWQKIYDDDEGGLLRGLGNEIHPHRVSRSFCLDSKTSSIARFSLGIGTVLDIRIHRIPIASVQSLSIHKKKKLLL